MSKGKFTKSRRRRSGSKSLALVLACVLLVGGVIGGTLAWLTADGGSVTNTFTESDIDITLSETKPENQTAPMIPGWTIEKDPKVTVVDGSEDCWLFVKIDEENNTVAGKNYKYVTYTVDSAWTLVEGTNNVYYIDLTKDGLVAAQTEKNILAGLQVSYSSELTKEDLNKVTDSTKPQLIFTAYAVQKEAATSADDAWDLVKNNPAN